MTELPPIVRDDPATSNQLPAPGTRLGPYELIHELRQGAAGPLYAACDTRRGHRVAIEFVRSTHATATERFLLEASAVARCRHDNVVAIHDVGEHGGQPFLVLEYLEGISLRSLLRGMHRLSVGRALEVIAPVVRALEAVHAHDIAHRVLKPESIYLTEAGIKVFDFGVAALLQPEPTPPLAARGETSRHGSLTSALPYLAPEQWAGAGRVDHQTDLWAVGIVLFEMLAGRHPLAPRAGWELLVTGVLAEPMPSLREACPRVSEALAEIVDRCLVKPKRHRMGSASELLAALEPLLAARHLVA